MSFFYVGMDEAQAAEDLRSVLRTAAGRRVLRRVLGKSNLMGSSFGGDNASTEFNEGLRRVGLWLAEKIETAAPGEFARLLAESSNDRLADEAKRKRRTDDDD